MHVDGILGDLASQAFQGSCNQGRPMRRLADWGSHKGLACLSQSKVCEGCVSFASNSCSSVDRQVGACLLTSSAGPLFSKSLAVSPRQPLHCPIAHPGPCRLPEPANAAFLCTQDARGRERLPWRSFAMWMCARIFAFLMPPLPLESNKKAALYQQSSPASFWRATPIRKCRAAQ